MSFLLDHDVCSRWLRNQPQVVSRVNQHAGRLHVSALSIVQIERWILRRMVPAWVMQGYVGFLNAVTHLDVNERVAHRAVMLERALRRQGHHLDVFALIVSATALHHNLALVTNDPLYQLVAGLTTEDWTLP